jgi:hypothetical protein
MDLNELRRCIDTSSGPRPAQAHGLAVHLVAFCWPGGLRDGYEAGKRDGLPRADLAVLPLPSCSCASGGCRLCN